MAQNLIRKDPRLLRSLQCFEAVARLGSVTDAATELAVSPSAISHQLRVLAEIVGEQVLGKKGRGVVLTPAGRRLADMLHVSFHDIDTVVSELVGETRPVVRLAVCSSFGPAWLAPRMPDMREAFPGLSIELRLYADQPQQTHEAADAIVTAEPIVPGYEAVTLFEELLVGVAQPARRSRGLTTHRVLITTELPPLDPLEEWGNYMRATGMAPGVGPDGWMACSHYLLALELAKSGFGAALVPDFLAASALREGSLVRLHDAVVPSGRTYRYCYKKSRAGETSLRHLGRWMRLQAQRLEVATDRAVEAAE